MTQLFDSMDEITGKTPLLKLGKMDGAEKADVLVKLEFFNPASSIKDRVAKNMSDQAEKSGALKPGGLIVEPTSGNTGIGLAMEAAARGYRLIIVMPETMSRERRLLMTHLGAELVLTPGGLGMPGAIEKAREIVSSTENAFFPDQFNNPANPQAHFQTTGPEIWDACEGKIDIFVAGVGTGGTLCGTGAYLKSRNPAVRLFAVEPESSPVLSGGKAGPHGIQGIGGGFVPGNYRKEIVDGILLCSDSDAITAAREAAAKEGILCGISSGANLHAALSLAKRAENAGKTIVTIACDTAERYLSTPLFS